MNTCEVCGSAYAKKVGSSYRCKHHERTATVEAGVRAPRSAGDHSAMASTEATSDRLQRARDITHADPPRDTTDPLREALRETHAARQRRHGRPPVFYAPWDTALYTPGNIDIVLDSGDGQQQVVVEQQGTVDGLTPHWRVTVGDGRPKYFHGPDAEVRAVAYANTHIAGGNQWIADPDRPTPTPTRPQDAANVLPAAVDLLPGDRTPLADHVDAIASEFHEQWRHPRVRPDSSFEPRLKTTIDPAWIAEHDTNQVDIANTDFVDLPEDWQTENRAAATAAIAAVQVVRGYRYGAFDTPPINLTTDAYERDQLGTLIHAAWLQRNAYAHGGGLDVAYVQLPVEEQLKDVQQAAAVLDYFQRRGTPYRRA